MAWGDGTPQESATTSVNAIGQTAFFTVQAAEREVSSLPPVEISREHHDALIAHAREEAPNECCGYIELKGDRVEDVVRSTNERASPYGFTLDGPSNLALYRIEDAGGRVAVYHSHPRSAPEPSQQDINLAEYPDRLMVIISLAGDPEVRAWRIADGRVEEESIQLA